MAVGDENIIETDVVRIVPDLSGFRSKLEAELAKATRGIEAKIKLVADRTGFGASIKDKVAEQQKLKNQPTLKVSLRADRNGFTASIREEVAKQQALKNPTLKIKLVADGKGLAGTAAVARAAGGAGGGGGGGGDNPFNFSEGDAKKDAAYLLRLKTKSIKDQLTLTRNGNEQVQAAEDAALKRNLDQAMKAFGKRFQLQLNGIKATSKAQQDADKEAERSLDTYYKDLQKMFDLQRGLANAEKARAREEQAATIERQRKDEAYLKFTEGIENQLRGLRENAAKEDEAFARDSARIKKGIESEGSKQRINLLEQEDKIKRKLEAEDNRRQAAKAQRSTIDQKIRSLFGDQNFLDFGREGIRPTTALIAAAVALSPVLLAVASSALQASAGVAALGSAAIGGGAAITGLLVSFTPVIKALKLAQTVRNEGLKNDANEASRKERILDAVDALGDAQRRLNQAHKDELRAQLAVNDARAQAIRDLQNLKQSVIDLNNELRGDNVSLQEAQDNQAATSRNFFATRLQNLRAAQDVADAQTNLQDTVLKRAQASQDLHKSLAQGIDGSDTVRNAKQAAQAATDSRLQAQRELGRAQRNVAQARRTTDPTSTSAATLADQIKRMSPAAREMYHLIDDNRKVFDRLARSIQQKVLPGFNDFIRETLKVGPDGASSLSIFADAAGTLGGKIGAVVGRLGKLTRDKGFRRDFKQIIKDNGTAMDLFGDAVVKLVKPFMQIFRASSPLLVRFAGYIDDIAGKFAAFIDKADRSGALTAFFQRTGDELKRWSDLGKNILGFLKGVFTASVGAGGSLLDKLTQFFADAAKWSNSPKGQAQMQRFFDRLADLPYAKIRDFLIHLGTLFAGFAGVNWALANPFWAAFTAFAASNPALAANLIKVTAAFVVDTLGFINEHRDAAATLLGILAAYRFVNRAAKIGITFPGIEALNRGLAGKFSVLEKFVGGGASTATMTVHAGVVNVYGAVSGTPGEPGGPGPVLVGPDGKPKPVNIDPRTGKPVYIDPKTKRPTFTAPGESTGIKGKLFGGAKGTLLTLVGSIVGNALLDHVFGATEPGTAKDQIKASASGALNGALIGSIFGPPGILIGGLIGAAVNEYIATGGILQHHPETDAYLKGIANSGNPAAKQQVAEGSSYANLLRSLANGGGSVIANNAAAADRFTPLQDYINDRRTSVTATANAIRAKQGEAAATKFLNTENVRSRDTLRDLLTQYGFTKKAAQEYADKVYGVRDATTGADKKTGDLTTKFDGLGNIIKDTKGKADGFKTSLDAVVGGHVIKISTAGYADTKKQLDLLYATQHVLYNPGYSNTAAGADTVSSQNQYLDPKTGLPKRLMKAAGGPIYGSGTALSDSIPAWLSNGEYVMPTNVVQHYGLDTMEAMRRRAVPRFAKGGAARNERTWPVTVYEGPRGFVFPTEERTGNFGPSISGGTATGDISVARIAEETARAMHASDKQLVALIEAGLVESGLRNLNYGDRDSLGFLQQRPSQGWGSAAQVRNVAYATRKFINAAKSRDKAGLTAGELAQAVQRSAFPARYDARLADAVAVLNQEAPYLTSYSGLGSSARLGNSSIMGWQAMWAALHAKFPHAKLFSGLRPGDHTLSGATSLHALGEAIDVSPVRAIAEWIETTFGAKVKELITPWTDLMLYHGKFHKYSKAIEAQHGVGRAGNDHIHWGMNTGGPVKARKYDTGGDLPPGFTLAYNGTGRNETVRTNQQERSLRQPAPGGAIRLDRRDMITIAGYIAGASSPTVQMDGREVARITNRYTYLPAGV